ncbi:hypothetical protein [Streptomyces daliensis]|uniref:Uncharacterized protein n=1 Tax=Streptomyces daliensis TaxID=299421 RepID=A0A8T4IYH6_9ACTN|nr:hypothetical protein [Streptomyces daliensis]
MNRKFILAAIFGYAVLIVAFTASYVASFANAANTANADWIMQTVHVICATLMRMMW